jgi:RNA polymerase sigma-70 factor (ECF subfamily)
MFDHAEFTEFLRRVRAGDAQAAEELVRRYEPAIRREVRLRLTDPRLYRVFDSMDVCQSVLGAFFLKAAAGQYQLERPEDLMRLLVGMTRKQLLFKARHQRAQRRDHRKVAADGVEEMDVSAGGPSPSRLVAGREMLQEFRNRLTEDERQVADLRGQGRTWEEIAVELGGTPDARRKQLGRAVDRVALELGLQSDA